MEASDSNVAGILRTTLAIFKQIGKRTLAIDQILGGMGPASIQLHPMNQTGESLLGCRKFGRVRHLHLADPQFYTGSTICLVVEASTPLAHHINESTGT